MYIMAAEEEDSWDAEDFDVDKGFAGKEWEGEDEGLDLSAIIEEDTKPIKEEHPTKSKEERIAEKKAKRRAAELATEAANETKVLSDQEEKMRKEALQKESDLHLAMETFGVSDRVSGGIDSMNPTSEEEFNRFKDVLSDKIVSLETSPHYVKFVEQLVIKCCGGLDVEDLRHVSTVLSTMATEKQKTKSAKTSKKKAAKASLGARAVGKGSRRIDNMDDYDNELGAEFDDFM